MKVEAIKGYKFNNIDFAGKKQKKQTQPHVTSPMKAVPVIVLMAMSPVNAPLVNAQQNSTHVKTEVVNKQNKIVASEEYPNATPKKNVKCTINYMSNDGDDTSVESVQLVFNEVMNIRNKQDQLSERRFVTNAVNMNTLIKRYIKNVSEDGYVTRDTVYYVSGPGAKIVKAVDLDGNILNRKSEQKNLSIEITKDFYNDLKSISDESITLKEEMVVNDGIDVPGSIY